MHRFAIALVLVVVSASVAQACDPNHDWKERDAFSRRLVGFQAAANLAEKAVEEARIRGLELKGGRIGLLGVEDRFRRVGVLDAAGEHARPRGPAELESQARSLELCMRQALKERGVELVPRARLAALAERWGMKGDWAYDPAFLVRAAKELRLGAFLKVDLQEYAQTLRLYRDGHPKNPGLWLVHTFSTARARVSVRRPDGAYAFIDEITGDGGNELLYFSEDPERPAPVRQIVQARSGRPGTASVNWQLYPDRDHFQ